MFVDGSFVIVYAHLLSHEDQNRDDKEDMR